MLKLYSFNIDCNRSGKLEGLFVAEEEEIRSLIGLQVNFGEVLGKHSDVSIDIDEGDISEESDDQDLIEKLLSIFDKSTICGYNPLEYISEDDIYNDDEEEKNWYE